MSLYSSFFTHLQQFYNSVSYTNNKNRKIKNLKMYNYPSHYKIDEY